MALLGGVVLKICILDDYEIRRWGTEASMQRRSLTPVRWLLD
jgi:hypothetical protein